MRNPVRNKLISNFAANERKSRLTPFLPKNNHSKTDTPTKKTISSSGFCKEKKRKTVSKEVHTKENQKTRTMSKKHNSSSGSSDEDDTGDTIAYHLLPYKRTTFYWKKACCLFLCKRTAFLLNKRTALD